MSRYSSLFATLFACSAMAATPDFSQTGFSTMDGGTTGGAGGRVVRPANLEELKRYAEDPVTPYVILVDKEMNTGIPVKVDADGAVGGSIASTYGDIVQVGSNKSIIGIGDKAFFNRVGLLIQKKRNIVVRNIKFTMLDVPVSKTDENKVVGWRNGAQAVLSDPDCISIQADSAASSYAQKKLQESRNIWIDHCEFYNDPQASTDRYDGLLDAKNNTYNVTISWNYFHDHHKGSLIGNSDTDEFEHKFTFHHNRFRNIVSRQPMVRFGRAHIYNNHIHQGGGNGVDVRIGSDMLIEKNRFDTLSKAIFGSDGGKARIVDNMTVGNSSKKTTIATLPEGTFVPPYPYKADPVADVAQLVADWAGVGKIDTKEYEQTSSVAPLGPRAKSITAWTETGKIALRAPTGQTVRVTDLAGRPLHHVRHRDGTVHATTRGEGVYLVTIGDQTERVFAK